MAIHFNTSKERLDFLKGKNQEYIPVEVIDEVISEEKPQESKQKAKTENKATKKEKRTRRTMAKYKLNDAETVKVLIQPLPVTKKMRNGKDTVTWDNHTYLVPGKKYETNDKAMIEFFKSYTRTVRHTAGIEEALKSANVPYEIKYCRSCGGRTKKISYKVVEVFDE